MTIISLEHKFIFIKTRKVASTSIEALLRNYLGKHGIATQLTPRDEKWCADRGLPSQNYSSSPPLESQYIALCQSGEYEAALHCLKGAKRTYVSHMPAHKVKATLENSGHRWDDFLTFSIDRHPYSWLLSLLLYDNTRYNLEGACDFDLDTINQRAVAFLESAEFQKKYNYNHYATNEEILVDEVLRYESLHDDISRILKPLVGSVELEKLPYLKKNSNHISPLDIFTEDTLSLINKKCAQTLDILDYQTGDACTREHLF